MTCKEAEKLIPSFLKDDLGTVNLREFMEHMDQCKECREELSIQFLVMEGMARLETGNVFDLQNELKSRMEEAEHIYKLRESLQLLFYVLNGLVAIAAIAVIILWITL